MPKLKREMFSRGVRMQHRFGAKDDPLMPGEYFDAPYPDGIKSVNLNGKGRFRGQTHGLHVYTEPFSPVAKANGGNASLSGPRLDNADAISDPIPMSTEMRRTQGPFIKGKKRTEK